MQLKKGRHTLRREIWTHDNLEMLASLPTDTVALIYMDPPFASNRSYDVYLSNARHAGAERMDAFNDRWQVGPLSTPNVPVQASSRLSLAFIDNLRESGMRDISNYLTMMLPRIEEAHRTLKSTGSLYLHCDTSASHYLKIILDLIFGPDNFRNEITWKRTHAHSGSRRFGPVHDIILFYTKSNDYVWNPSFTAYDPEYLEKHYRQTDDRGNFQLITCTAPGDRTGTRAHYEWRGQLPPPGRHWAWKIEKMIDLENAGLLVHSSNGVPRMKRYTDDSPGVALQDVWMDIKRLDAHSEERVGYDTQKPTALLERIISASTMPGDLVVDPFGGSGTTAVAAEQLGREWITSDSSLLASSFALARTRQLANKSDIRLVGFPENVKAATNLLKTDPQTFGVWGTSMLATITDRKSFSTSVASGSGRMKLPGRSVDFLSWVPFSSSAVPTSSPPRTRKRLPTRGLLLRSGRSAAAMRTWISHEIPALPVTEIELSDLVSAQSRREGLSDRLSHSLVTPA